jgi:hypothetical protein
MLIGDTRRFRRTVYFKNRLWWVIKSEERHSAKLPSWLPICVIPAHMYIHPLKKTKERGTLASRPYIQTRLVRIAHFPEYLGHHSPPPWNDPSHFHLRFNGGMTPLHQVDMHLIRPYAIGPMPWDTPHPTNRRDVFGWETVPSISPIAESRTTNERGCWRALKAWGISTGGSKHTAGLRSTKLKCQRNEDTAGDIVDPQPSPSSIPVSFD